MYRPGSFVCGGFCEAELWKEFCRDFGFSENDHFEKHGIGNLLCGSGSDHAQQFD
jgi:hypothetical protein